MSKGKISLLAKLICFFIFFSCSQNTEELKLKGSYLGMTPPDAIAQLFAPGIISTNLHDDGAPLFTPDGQNVFWRIYGLPHSIFASMKQQNGIWSKPFIPSFSGRYMEQGLAITHDGRRLFFGSTRPLTGDSPKDFDIWYVDSEKDFSNTPLLLDKLVNTDAHEFPVSVTKDGTLWFQRAISHSGIPKDYYMCNAKITNGIISNVVTLGSYFQSEYLTMVPAISPDGDYIVFSIRDKPDGFGDDDLYVSFRKSDNTWTRPRNVGNAINSPSTDCFPKISTDGKFLFFVSWRAIEESYSTHERTYEEWIKTYNSPQNGWGADVYWVSTEIIKKLSRDK